VKAMGSLLRSVKKTPENRTLSTQCFVCLRVRACMYVCVCVYVCMYVCMYMCVCVCVCMCVWMDGFRTFSEKTTDTYFPNASESA